MNAPQLKERVLQNRPLKPHCSKDCEIGDRFESCPKRQSDWKSCWPTSRDLTDNTVGYTMNSINHFIRTEPRLTTYPTCVNFYFYWMYTRFFLSLAMNHWNIFDQSIDSLDKWTQSLARSTVQIYNFLSWFLVGGFNSHWQLFPTKHSISLCI